MNRNITDVCKEILKIIPDGVDNCDAVKLRNEIEDYIDKTLVFKAPELLSNGNYFKEVAIILNKNIPTITEDWHKSIKKYFNNE